MRSAVLGFVAILAAGLAALLVVGLTQGSSLVYSLGVNPASVAAELRPGDRACQAPILPPRDTSFDRVGFLLGTHGQPGPEMRVEVIEDRTSRRLAAGTLPAGYPDLDFDNESVVPVGRVRAGAPLRICLVNEGSRPVAVVGQVGIASPPTAGTLNGKPIASDLTLDLRAGRRSLLALLPDIAERAARFRAGWVTPAVYLALALAILIGAPLALGRGIARAARAD